MILSRKRVLLYSIFCLLLFQLCGCREIGMVLRQAFQKPQMKFQKVHFRKISFTGVDTDFEFKLHNPNSIGTNFKFIQYRLDVAGSMFAEGTTTKGLRIKPRGSSDVFVPFSIQYMKFAKSLYQLFKSKDAVKYRLRLKFGFETPIGVVSVPFDLKGNIPIPKPPEIKFHSAKVLKAGWRGATVEFAVKVINRAKFPVTLNGISYKLLVSNSTVSSGKSNRVDIAQSKFQIIKIPFSVSTLGLGGAVLKMIMSKKLSYQFRGNIDLGIFKKPFDFKGDVGL